MLSACCDLFRLLATASREGRTLVTTAAGGHMPRYPSIVSDEVVLAAVEPPDGVGSLQGGCQKAGGPAPHLRGRCPVDGADCVP